MRPIRLSTGSAAVLGVRSVGLLLSASTMLLLAALLDPADLGSYYLLVIVPSSALALFSFGLPAGLTYFAGRGASLDHIRTLGLVLAAGLSTALVAIVLVVQPLLASTIAAAVPADLIVMAGLAIPGVFVTSFAGAVLLGRQHLRAFNGLILVHGVALLVGQVVVVGGLQAGLVGALATFVTVSVVTGAAGVVLLLRLGPFRPAWSSELVRDLLGYGIRLQPASLAGYFNYRADVFLISALLQDPTALGIYGLAVNIAELCFYVPDAVATVLFPRVAASDHPTAARLIPQVCRVTLLLTTGAALALAAATVVVIPIALPQYAASVGPVLILLPGIVGLSASKILSGFLSGIGRPGRVSLVAVGALVLNLAANLLLIPGLGATGAATASLISYSANGVAMVGLAARDAGVPARALVLPTIADVTAVYRAIIGPLAVGRTR